MAETESECDHWQSWNTTDFMRQQLQTVLWSVLHSLISVKAYDHCYLRR